MPLPFHWLFRGETWKPDAYTDERFTKVVSKVLDKGLSKREVQTAFRRKFGIKVAFNNGKPSVGPNDMTAIRQNFGAVQLHFLRFVNSGMTYDDYCTWEEKLDAKPQTSSADAPLPAWAKEIVGEGIKLPESKAKPYSGNNAARGFYMGQMLNQQHQTNEHLQRLRDMLGGS
jgi:hypothetical protein